MLFPIAAILALLPFILRSDSGSSAAIAKLCTLLYIAIRLLPLVVRLCGIAIGKNIRGKTHHRRELLLAHADQEEKDFTTKHKKADEDWEKVDARSSGPSTPADAQDKDWQGVVGFFHPFW